MFSTTANYAISYDMATLGPNHKVNIQSTMIGNLKAANFGKNEFYLYDSGSNEENNGKKKQVKR